MNRAVFLDKDGTLIKDVPYNVNPDLIALEEYAGEGLQLIRCHHYKLIVVSNQPGVAKGYFRQEDLAAVNRKIQELLKPYHIRIHAFYYCPHSDAMACNCRKPAAGLILQAAMDLDINLKDSWMVGDILNDVEAGNRAGCTTILINNGHETEWMLTKKRRPHYITRNLQLAAGIICSH